MLLMLTESFNDRVSILAKPTVHLASLTFTINVLLKSDATHITNVSCEQTAPILRDLVW